MKTKKLFLLLSTVLLLSLTPAYAETPPAVDSPFDSTDDAPPTLNFGSVNDDPEDTPPVLSGSTSNTSNGTGTNVTPPPTTPTTPVTPTQPKPVVTVTPKKVTNSGPETMVFLALALMGGYLYRKIRA